MANAVSFSVSELMSEFPFLGKGKLEFEIQYNTYKTERGFKKYLTKLNDEKKALAEMSDIKKLEISVEWHKSRVWGNNPTAHYRCWFVDGSFKDGQFSRGGGCGYDKESTVIADVFNECARGMLWRKVQGLPKREDGAINLEGKPYGCSVDSRLEWFPHFEGGVGTNCYYRIAEWLGKQFKCVASGKTYDAYVME